MYYKYDTSGLYCGTCLTQESYTTTVAPPDENVTAKWVWNHVNWVGLPLTWEYVPAPYNPPPPEELNEEPVEQPE
jgi:hypothetical protein